MIVNGYEIKPFADLSRANLYGADLYGADLCDAYLYEADLRGANFSGANLYDAYLYEADLRGANFSGANLRGTNFSGANLRGANLRGANLRGANFSGANLRGADLGGANLSGADLSKAKDIPELVAASLNIPPTEGSFIAWKKAGRHIVKLEIPARAKRSSATGRKCRASYVKTLAIYPDDVKEVVSQRGGVYRVGRLTRCHDWDPNRWKECSGGIHFFMTREEAEAW